MISKSGHFSYVYWPLGFPFWEAELWSITHFSIELYYFLMIDSYWTFGLFLY